MRILIVDDSRVMRNIVARTLRQAGFESHDIDEASDGQEGYDKVMSAAPDLILSDWNMPEMSGIEFLRALRRSGNSTPFGFVTSEGSEQMREQASDSGASFLIAKPFTPDQFKELLGPVLS